ncbi:helix-turn-helix domain-containing protein [Streptomyces sp. NPDC090093]|uniref:helix-turn-helix domain-containing protein n=1 Tax=Streptomyces sp. NPDC090093 TaxID=3365945 RepID=UPI0037F853DB
MVSFGPLEAGSLSETVAAIKELITALNRDQRILEPDKIRLATGIPLPLIQSVLDGEEVDLDSMTPPLAERVKFLRETRLVETKEGKERPYTYEEIANGVGVTKATVSNILNAKKGASSDVTVALASFFNVQVGYFLDPWSKVLHDALLPKYQQLKDLALLQRVGIKTIHFRGNRDLDDQLGQEVRAALREAIEAGPSTRHQDREIQELAEDLESLPPGRRRSVIPVIKNLLGLIKPDEPDTSR